MKRPPAAEPAPLGKRLVIVALLLGLSVTLGVIFEELHVGDGARAPIAAEPDDAQPRSLWSRIVGDEPRAVPRATAVNQRPPWASTPENTPAPLPGQIPAWRLHPRAPDPDAPPPAVPVPPPNPQTAPSAMERIGRSEWPTPAFVVRAPEGARP